MKLTNQTDRYRFLHTYQIKDAATLRHILEGDPVSFVNVRHPYERLVSAFTMTKNAGHLAVEKTFKEFIVKDVLMKVNRSKNERPYRAMNPHWRPSNTYCAYCNIRQGVIFRLPFPSIFSL